MVREAQDINYRGNRRLSGNFGRLYINNILIFELVSFELKVNVERDEVIIGVSADSKITKLVGEGSLRIKQVFNRGLRALLNQYKRGHDERVELVGVVEDPDAVGSQKERIKVTNVWFNNLDIMNFEKGAVIEKEYNFGFTPEDLEFLENIEI